MTAIVEPLMEMTGADVLRAMEIELRLLGELREALARQRDGVAQDDPGMIEAATHGVARGVFTLDEARRRRERITQLATDGEPVALSALERHIGPLPGLDEARRALRHAAEDTTRDLSLNQAILRRALRSGETYLQALFASVTGSTDDPSPTSGMLLNRSA